MSIYTPSETSINRELDEVPIEERHIRRLQIDIVALLTGPTSFGRAKELVEGLFATSAPNEIAAALQEAAIRYIRAEKELHPEPFNPALLPWDDEDDKLAHGG